MEWWSYPWGVVGNLAMILTAAVNIHELFNVSSRERTAIYRGISNFLILYSR